MMQYLSKIKQKVDTIQAAGSSIDAEDIILYTLNGLPPAYNGFKTAISTKLHPINLDDLYALLCSEEVNINADEGTEHTTMNQADPSFALEEVNYPMHMQAKESYQHLPDSKTHQTLLQGSSQHGLYPIKSSAGISSPLAHKYPTALVALLNNSISWNQRLRQPSTFTHKLLATAFAHPHSPSSCDSMRSCKES